MSDSASAQADLPRVGVFGCGLKALFDQFEGMKEETAEFVNRITEPLSDVAVAVNFGIVDNEAEAARTSDKLRQANIDLLLVIPGIYVTSSVVMPVIRRTDVPILVLNTQQDNAVDCSAMNQTPYLNRVGVMIKNTGSVCSVPEICGLLKRTGKRVDVVTGRHQDPGFHDQIRDRIAAVHVIRQLRGSRLGIFGSAYPGMLDLNVDRTMLEATLGIGFEDIELDELEQEYRQLHDDQVRATRDSFLPDYRLDESLDDDPDLTSAIKILASFENVIARRRLNCFTLFWNAHTELLEEIFGNSMPAVCTLTARGVPSSGEGDIMTAIMVKMTQLLTGNGSFCEYWNMDFDNDRILVGHDGPANYKMAADTPWLRKLELLHGKTGGGYGVEFRLRPGPVTITNLNVNPHGRLKMIVATAMAVEGETYDVGNHNTWIELSDDIPAFFERWFQAGPGHHFAIACGDHTRRIGILARMLDVECEMI